MQVVEKKFEFGNTSRHRQDASSAIATTVPTSFSGGPLKSYKSGALSVAIWENENLTTEGQISSYRSVSFERRYKDKSGEWKSTNSLRVNDLPKAALLLSKAYEYLILTGEHEEVTA